jgi:Mannosylglycerate hydrolase MGH1-like glycoside hydrolase domain
MAAPQIVRNPRLASFLFPVFWLCIAGSWLPSLTAYAQTGSAAVPYEPFPLSPQYQAVQQRLARGWNTWDVNSVATQVLVPQGLAIHLSLKHNSTLNGEALLVDPLIGRLSPNAEQVFPGPHAWDGSYTDLRISWKNHLWRVQSAHEGQDLVFLATPLPSETKEALPPTLLFSVDFLWNQEGTVSRSRDSIVATSPAGTITVFCTCALGEHPSGFRRVFNISPITGPYFAADFTGPVAVSTGKPRSLTEVQAAIERARNRYEQSLGASPATRPIVDAIETTLGWDTIFEPEKRRVVSPVSRVWSVSWGGYVIFDWDTFFAATLASVGDHDLALADAVETLRESTPEGFVPNYARAGNWKSFDRSEPPVGAITVLGLYQKYGDRWFLDQTFPALLNWNRWWAQHRDIDGYLAWGSDDSHSTGNLDDPTRDTRAGAILESGLDNSPMYDDATFNAQTHLLQFADVGLMSMYIADCDALAAIADILHKTGEASELRSRGAAYRQKLQTLWSASDGIFLNKDLRTRQFSRRLSPTNFYPLLAHVATPAQAQEMVSRHLLNPAEFWGEWVIPSIARNDPAFHDQNYWRGRIWGPMNYLVYLGLRNYDLPQARSALADKSYALFLKEWREHGHVHENYNAILGTGDDVSSSDRFYHWGALLGYMKYLEETAPSPRHP